MKIGRTFFRFFPRPLRFKLWHYGPDDDCDLLVIVKAGWPFFQMWKI